MDDSIRRLLGIRKKTSFLYDAWYAVRNIFTARLIIVLFFAAVFIPAVVLFARVEVMQRPEVMQELEMTGMSPYFVSVYWLVTTIATVGYGDVVPITLQGRLLALFMMVMGVLSLSLIISQVTSKIVALNLGSMFGVTRAKKKIDSILCGWNPISQAAYEELKGPGVEVVVIDKTNRPELAKSRDIHFIAGDPTNPDILKRANVTNAKSIVLAMDMDSEVLLAIHVIRELNPWINIVAKINNHEHIKIAESAGADQVVSPPSIGGRLLSMVADEPAVVDWVIKATSAEKGTQLIEMDVTKESPFVEKTIGEIRKNLGNKAKVIGVDTAEGLKKVPAEDLKIETGNKLIMLIDTKKFRI